MLAQAITRMSYQGLQGMDLEKKREKINKV